MAGLLNVSYFTVLAVCLLTMETLAPYPVATSAQEVPPDKVTTPTFSISQIFEVCRVSMICLSGTRVKIGQNNTDKEGTEKESDQECVENNSCQIMLMYGQGRNGIEAKDNELLIELYANQQRSWVAVGFSYDLKMGKDFVVECVWEGGKEHNISVYTSINHFDENLKEPFNLRNPEAVTKKLVRLIAKSRPSAYMWCLVAIRTDLPLLPTTITTNSSSLSETPYYILLAEGNEPVTSTGHGGVLTHHLPDKQYLYKNATSMKQKFAPTSKQQRLLYAHAHVMIFAWMFFIPVALFAARFYKETFLNLSVKQKKYLKWQLWLVIHVSCSMIGLVLMLIGYALLTVAKSDWDYVDGMRPTDHLYSGIGAASIFTTTAYTAIFLEERDPKMTFHYAEFIHGGMGHLSIFFAFWSLASAHKVYYANASCGVPYVASIWLISYLGFNGLMSYHYLWVDWVKGKTGWFKSLIGMLESLFQPYDPTKTEDAPGSAIRKRIFYIFVGTTATLTVIMSLVYGLSAPPCYNPKDYLGFIYRPTKSK